MSDSTRLMDSAQCPPGTADKKPPIRSPPVDFSSHGSRALGSLGSLDEADQSRQCPSFSTDAQQSPLSSHNRFPFRVHKHPSPCREPTASQTSISERVRERNLESLKSAQQNLATPAHHVDDAFPQSSTAQSSRKATVPPRFLSSSISHSGDRLRDDEGPSTGTRGVRALFQADPMMSDGMASVTSDSGQGTFDEGRMVARDAGMKTGQHDSLTRYPDDILILTMTFLTPRDILSVSQTCRLLRILSSCSTIWKVFYFSNRGWRINQEAAQQHVDVSHDSTMIASGQSADRSSFDSPMGCRAGHVLNNWPETPAKKPLSRLISSPSRGKSARQTSETPLHRRVDDPQNAILDWHTIYKERTELERRWQSGEPAQVTVLQVHDDAVYCCYLLGRTIITGSRDHSIKFWDHEVGIGGDPKLLHHIPEAHRLSVLCIQVDPGDLKHRGMMVTGSSDANITVWALRGFLHGDEKQCLGAQNTLRDASKSEKPKQVAVLTGHKAGVLDLLLSPDNTKIVSCSQDATIKIWNRDTLHLTHNFPFQTGPVNCLSAQPDGQLFVSASGDGTIMLWDLNKCQLIKKLYQGAPGLACIAFTADGLIYFGGSDRKFNALDFESGEIVKYLEGHRDLVRRLVIKPELERLVSGSYDQDVRIWDLGNERCVGALADTHMGMVFCVASDATRIVSVSQDASMAVQDFAVGLKYAALFA